MSRVDAVVDAVQAACKGDGEAIVVDLDAFERALKRAKVPVEKANKAALNADLQATREELRVQRTRAANSDDPAAFASRLGELESYEAELTEQLWPRKEGS